MEIGKLVQWEASGLPRNEEFCTTTVIYWLRENLVLEFDYYSFLSPVSPLCGSFDFNSQFVHNHWLNYNPHLNIFLLPILFFGPIKRNITSTLLMVLLSLPWDLISVGLTIGSGHFVVFSFHIPQFSDFMRCIVKGVSNLEQTVSILICCCCGCFKVLDFLWTGMGNVSLRVSCKSGRRTYERFVFLWNSCVSWKLFCFSYFPFKPRLIMYSGT